MTPNLITLTEPASPAAEAYRSLRANLMSADREKPLRTLLVVAAADDPDKATTVADLAVSFARVGKRVILVDCDLRTPRQHTLFGLSNAAGIAAAVTDPAALTLQATAVEGLRVLASGPQTAVPSDLPASPAMTAVIVRLREEADLVIIDAPAIAAATDAVELATQVDGVLLTVRAGQTKRDEAQQAKDRLNKVGARVVGAALVNVAGR